MVLVIPQVLLPVLAILCLQTIVNADDKKALMPRLKKGVIATGIVFGFLLVLYFTFDFMGARDTDLIKRARDANQPQLLDFVNSFIEGLKQDRKSLMMGDILRSLGFILAAAALLFLLIRKTISPLIAVSALTVFVLIDLMVVNAKYLNAENYQEQEENTAAFVQTAADQTMLADKSYYRVFNVNGNAFNENLTSYYYNSVGGYHPAKLLIYQDLIENKLSTQQPNMNVFNMLNTKYFIEKDGSGQTQNLQTNPAAFGPCWFASSIMFVKDSREEMNLLGNFHTRDTALVEQSFKAQIPFMPSADSAATIQLVKNENETISYTSNSSTNQFAVFSEVYYDKGWKAFIDGKESPIVKVNYVLRGLAVPAGKHAIEFKFEPQGYYTGKTITNIFTVALLLLLAGAAFMEWKNRKEKA